MPFGIFAALPPEINVGRLIAGAGPAPMLMAAAGYSAIAQTLNTLAAGSDTQVQTLMATWRGSAADRAQRAFGNHTGWLRETAGIAQAAASKAMVLGQAYATAVATSPSLAEIIANRTAFAALAAANGNGATTAAMATLEADYLRMWAQAAAAMSVYDAQATSAMMLTPSTAAPTVASATQTQAATSGSSSSSDASQLLSTVTSLLAPLLTSIQAAQQQQKATDDAKRAAREADPTALHGSQPIGLLGAAPTSPTLAELNGGIGSNAPISMTTGGVGLVPAGMTSFRPPSNWPVGGLNPGGGVPSATPFGAPAGGANGSVPAAPVGSTAAPVGAIAPRTGVSRSAAADGSVVQDQSPGMRSNISAIEEGEFSELPDVFSSEHAR